MTLCWDFTGTEAQSTDIHSSPLSRTFLLFSCVPFLGFSLNPSLASGKHYNEVVSGTKPSYHRLGGHSEPERTHLEISWSKPTLCIKKFEQSDEF